MEFDIDVSGEDILSKNYTIVIADKNYFIRGYKFDEKTIQLLKSRHGEGRYRYGFSKQQKAFLRVRIYCIIIYYLFNDILSKIKNINITLNICRDFEGHEKDITSFLFFLLGDKLGLKIELRYLKLSNDSNADKYAHLMRKDKKNLIKGYVKISFESIEKFLK